MRAHCSLRVLTAGGGVQAQVVTGSEHWRAPASPPRTRTLGVRAYGIGRGEKPVRNWKPSRGETSSARMIGSRANCCSSSTCGRRAHVTPRALVLLVPVRSLPEGAGVVQSNRVRGKMRDDDAAAVLRGGDRLAFRFAHLPAPPVRVHFAAHFSWAQFTRGDIISSLFLPMPAGWRWALAAAAAAAAGGARGLDLKCGADHDCSMLPDMADPANLRHLKCVLRRSSRVSPAGPSPTRVWVCAQVRGVPARSRAACACGDQKGGGAPEADERGGRLGAAGGVLRARWMAVCAREGGGWAGRL